MKLKILLGGVKFWLTEFLNYGRSRLKTVIDYNLVTQHSAVRQVA